MLALPALLSEAELVCNADVGFFVFEAVGVPLVLASPLPLVAVVLGVFALAMLVTSPAVRGFLNVERSSRAETAGMSADRTTTFLF